MLRLLVPLVLIATPPALAAEDQVFASNGVSEIDAINCYLDVPTYNGFAFAVAGEDDLAARRDWRKIETGNPFMSEYELPSPIVVTGHHETSRIGFTSSGIVAILDVADPEVIAREEGITNAMDPEPLIDAIAASGKTTRAQVEKEITFRKFLGERVMVDVTEPAADGDDFGTHTTITRIVSNVTTHPGKTLYGCSYRIELLGKDGKPL